MQTSNFIIRIPEPCHEDWNSMKPDAKGKFCNSCNKSVFDFSNKTDAEIRDILVEYKDQKVCGHFKKTQVNRPLNISVNFNDLPKNMSITKIFAIALFLVFGTFLFSCTNEKGQKVDTIEVIKPVGMNEPGVSLGEPMLPPDFTTTVTTMGSYGTGGSVVVESIAHVDGGMEVEEIYGDVGIASSIDSQMEEEPIIDNVIVGQMIMPYTEIADTITSDTAGSLTNKKLNEMKPDAIASKGNTFEIYPNPSSGQFTIRYEVVKKSDVSLVIYDMKGVLVQSLVNIHDQHEGKYRIPVNSTDLPNGIYVVSLIIGDKRSTEKLVLEQ